MPAVDLAAIRARRAVACERPSNPEEFFAAVQTLAVDDVPALLARVEALEAALVRERARYDACAMALGDCGNRRMVAERAAKDWRDIAEARDRDAKAEAHPPVDRYRVQVWDAADADLPSWGWSSISSARDTADEAAEVMARRRERRPEFGPMRVIRVRESYAVVATEETPVASGVGPPSLAPQGTPDPQGPQAATQGPSRGHSDPRSGAPIS